MNFGVLQALILLIAWVPQCTSTKFKLEKVTTRWVHGDKKKSNTMSLPDYIQIDLQLENGKGTLNLIKQSRGSIKLPLIVTQLEGQRSVWKPSKSQYLGIYKDPLLDASATVAMNKVNGVREVLYMVTFTHGNKSFFLEPETAFEGNPSFDKLEVQGRNKSIHNNKIIISIDGRLHSIVEIPATQSHQKDQLEREQSRGMRKDVRLVKRSVPVPSNKRLMTIKIFVLTDHSIFMRFSEISKGSESEDVVKNIVFTFTHIMEQVRHNYESIEVEDLKFTIELVGILVAQSSLDFTGNWKCYIDHNTLDAEAVITNLRNWWETNKANGKDGLELPNFDSLVALTDYHLEYLGQIVYGAADTPSICIEPGMSVVRYTNFFIVVNTITHELGHNLGLLHDGEGNKCTNSDFVLSQGVTAKTSLNSSRFSECSISFLKTAIDELDKSNTNCFADRDSNGNRERDIFLQLYPGQIYSIHEQCSLHFGSGSAYCGGVIRDQQMCQTIDCTYRGSCRTVAKLRAMDGTSCSNGSWCIQGNCVPDIRAPRAPTQCISGDARHLSYEYTCKDISEGLLKCYYRDECCATCSPNRIRSADKGCQDTSDECQSLKPRDCYNSYYATTCCKTCKSLETYPEEESCLYGDRGDGCLDLVPEMCHLGTNYCCRTCAAYYKSTNETMFLTTLSTLSVPANPSTSTLTKTDASTNGNRPSTTNTGSASPTSMQVTSTSTRPSTFSHTTDSTSATIKHDPTTVLVTSYCTQEDFNGTLEYITVWGIKIYLNCSQLARHDSSLCHDDTVQRYCCKACSTVKVINGYCTDGDSKKLLEYRSKSFTCPQLVKYNPRLCEDKNTKNKCCESCARFSIKPMERKI